MNATTSPSLLIKSALGAIGLAFALAAGAHADSGNLGFESVTSGWVQTGAPGNFTAPTAVPGFYETINPVEGTHLGLVSNAGVATQSIAKTLAIPAVNPGEKKFLVFNYRFLTDEYNQPTAGDTAQAVLTPTGGSPVTLFAISRDTLQPAGAGLLPTQSTFLDTQTIGQKVWQTSSTEVTAYAGKTVTLTFSVGNGAGPDLLFASRLAVDNVQVASVPDTGRPTVKIADRSQTVTTSKFLLHGTAVDPRGRIARVEIRVGKGSFKPAKGTARWKLLVGLKPGRNAIEARSVDVAGNISKPVGIVITRVAPRK